MDQEPRPNEQIAGDRLLKTLGIDPHKWTVGDRRIALLGIGIGLTIVIITVCGYVFGWAWTGLTKPQQGTFWDWLSLLIVPIVLALGGYLFNRSESRRTQEAAEERRQDDMLQPYLADMTELLLDKQDARLVRLNTDDEVREVVQARTEPLLRSVNATRKWSVVLFLALARLLDKERPIVSLEGADLREVNGYGAPIKGIDLAGANLRKATLETAFLQEANLSGSILFVKLVQVGRGLEPHFVEGGYLEDVGSQWCDRLLYGEEEE